jgi:LmbE family N-acetylglucosaminyl deacetylase
MSHENDLNKILFIGSHCDDIELGCGGAIHKWQNYTIDCVVLSQYTIKGQPLIDASTKALKSLGARDIHFYHFSPSYFHNRNQEIWEVLSEFDTDYGTIFTQEPDQHQDHEAVYKITNRLFQGKNIITYCSSVLSCPNFKPNWFVTINEDNLKAKLAALETYDTYQEKPYFRPDLIRAQAVINGVLSSSNLAEGFAAKRVINAVPSL